MSDIDAKWPETTSVTSKWHNLKIVRIGFGIVSKDLLINIWLGSLFSSVVTISSSFLLF